MKKSKDAAKTKKEEEEEELLNLSESEEEITSDFDDDEAGYSGENIDQEELQHLLDEEMKAADMQLKKDNFVGDFDKDESDIDETESEEESLDEDEEEESSSEEEETPKDDSKIKNTNVWLLKNKDNSLQNEDASQSRRKRRRAPKKKSFGRKKKPSFLTKKMRSSRKKKESESSDDAPPVVKYKRYSKTKKESDDSDSDEEKKLSIKNAGKMFGRGSNNVNENSESDDQTESRDAGFENLSLDSFHSCHNRGGFGCSCFDNGDQEECPCKLDDEDICDFDPEIEDCTLDELIDANNPGGVGNADEEQGKIENTKGSTKTLGETNFEEVPDINTNIYAVTNKENKAKTGNKSCYSGRRNKIFELSGKICISETQTGELCEGLEENGDGCSTCVTNKKE